MFPISMYNVPGKYPFGGETISIMLISFQEYTKIQYYKETTVLRRCWFSVRRLDFVAIWKHAICLKKIATTILDQTPSSHSQESSKCFMAKNARFFVDMSAWKLVGKSWEKSKKRDRHRACFREKSRAWRWIILYMLQSFEFFSVYRGRWES